MSSVRDWRPARLVLLWVGAVVLSVVLYLAIGAFFLIKGLSEPGASSARSGDGPLATIAFLAVVFAPLAAVAGLTGIWLSVRKRGGR